jgi:hypothetical protein
VLVALPPAPVQTSVKLLLALSGPTDSEPAKALIPLQPPDAVQLLALVDVHCSMALC